MGAFTIHHKGFVRTEAYLNYLSNKDYNSILRKAAEEGLAALKEATPVDTGKTADSWSYKITGSNGNKQIVWTNSNAPEGVSVAILIQYGHASQNGVWIEGRDFINPALAPVFDKLVARLKEEVRVKP